MASGNKHCLFNSSRKSQTSSFSHSSKLITKAHLKYANPFPFADTELENLGEEKVKGIKNRLI